MNREETSRRLASFDVASHILCNLHFCVSLNCNEPMARCHMFNMATPLSDCAIYSSDAHASISLRDAATSPRAAPLDALP